MDASDSRLWRSQEFQTSNPAAYKCFAEQPPRKLFQISQEKKSAPAFRCIVYFHGVKNDLSFKTIVMKNYTHENW